MSTGNFELGAFDRAIQAATSLSLPTSIVSASKAVIATTAQHWLTNPGSTGGQA